MHFDLLRLAAKGHDRALEESRAACADILKVMPFGGKMVAGVSVPSTRTVAPAVNPVPASHTTVVPNVDPLVGWMELSANGPGFAGGGDDGCEGEPQPTVSVATHQTPVMRTRATA